LEPWIYAVGRSRRATLNGCGSVAPFHSVSVGWILRAAWL